jgi:serine/threonine-protein kinase
MGTPAYMSPEQALGERDVDGRSDIYSLGVVGYQMLAGQPPFAASNTPALLMKHVSEPPRPIAQLRPDAPPTLVGAISRALAKKPEERWRDAAQFRDAVAGVGAAGAAATAIADRGRRAEGGRRSPEPESAHSAQRPLPAPWQRDRHDAERPRDGRPRRTEERERQAARKAERDAAKRAADFDQRPMEERVVVFRRKLAGNATTIGLLAAINMLTVPDFWWFLFPTAFMTVDILSKAGSLWADGVGLRQVFGRRPRAAIEAGAPSAGRTASAEGPEQYAARLVSADVLRGPHGRAVQRAAAYRAAILDVVAKLDKADREMIPDVTPTVEALAQRVGSVASTLHRLDEDVSTTSLASLDQRLSVLRADPETSERQRRLMLLERQRTTLSDLLERRNVLYTQLESAGLALENLKLDLYKLRSAGITASISDVTSATQQARAVSREIGHVLEAAEDIRKL